MFTLAFWKAAVERAVKTAAQALLGLWLVSDTGPFNVFTVSLQEAAGIAVGAAVLSVLTSLVSLPFGSPGPSLGGEVLEPQKVDA